MLRSLAALACVLSLGLIPAAAVGTTPPPPVPASAPLPADTVARILAGLPPPPGHPLVDRLVATPEWQAHRAWAQASWAEVNPRLEAMRRWRDAELGRPQAAPRTLVYPFSGPDFLNAVTLFPGHARAVFFSLERPGRLPELERIDPAGFGRLLADVRNALTDLLERNYFITDYMTRQLTTPYVKGTVPVMAVMMVLTGHRITSIEPLDVFPHLTREYAAPADTRSTGGRPRIPMRSVRIAYAGGDGLPKSLDYHSLDATDRALRWYPDFPALLAGTRPATVFLKSASYLLHDRQFARVREALLEAADVVVQDDTGVPYRHLVREGWAVSLYGVYTPPIAPMGYAAQPDLEAAYRAAAPVPPVDFPFGYSGRLGRSALLVARRPQ
jgi:hypothetical protein